MNISGCYELSPDKTFNVQGDTWKIIGNSIVNETKGNYISGLFEVKNNPEFKSMDYQGKYYLVSIDQYAIYIAYTNDK